MTDFAHLDPDIRRIMSLPKQSRIDRVFHEHWFDNSRADQAFEVLDLLVNRPPKPRMRSLVIVGEPGVGKSWLLKRYRDIKQQRAARDPLNPSRAASTPVIISRMPPNPREGSFWSAVLEAMSVSFNPKEHVEVKRRQAMNSLRALGTRALVIDEFQHILEASAKEQRGLLSLTKTLCDELEMPIIVVGNQNAVRALYTDPQLTTRFQQFRVEEWKRNQEFRQLLGTIEQILPLAEPSNLPSSELYPRIHLLSGGVMAVLLELLRSAAVLAIKNGTERITMQLIEEAWDIVKFDKEPDRPH